MKLTRKQRRPRMTVLGCYELDERGAPIRRRIDVDRSGDHGADPLGDGTFRMVPSGDVVDAAERDRRLSGVRP